MNNKEAKNMSQKEELVPRWYVVHTYSGYENKVKTDLEKTIKNRELEEYFFDIIVPMEEQIEIKEGQRKTNLKKVGREQPFFIKKNKLKKDSKSREIERRKERKRWRETGLIITSKWPSPPDWVQRVIMFM